MWGEGTIRKIGGWGRGGNDQRKGGNMMRLEEIYAYMRGKRRKRKEWSKYDEA